MKHIPETPDEITIEHAQRCQPWAVPYSENFEGACRRGMPHLRATHAVLHAQKSLGKIATVLEAIDHRGGGVRDEERATVAAMAADLFTVALRLANLFSFSLGWELARRVKAKNGVDLMTAPRRVQERGDIES